MQASYHSVETFGTVDGRGIRYVLFLSGCTMGCVFCHNPDTWSYGEKTITVAQVLADLNKYRRFYEASGGGITVSGGEPLLQADFVEALFKACREAGIHTTLDTAGCCPPESAARVARYTDEVLFCLKAASAAGYKELTAVDNTEVLANLRFFAAATSVTVRYVVIPGVNNAPADLRELAGLLKTLPRPLPVELLAYHELGREKWAKLGMPYRLEGIPSATAQQMAEARRILTSQGVVVLYDE